MIKVNTVERTVKYEWPERALVVGPIHESELLAVICELAQGGDELRRNPE